MAERTDEPRFARILVLCMAVLVGLEAIVWVTGFKGQALRESVEQGAAQAELRAVGETDEETIRENVRTQQDTLPFWTAIAMIGDFFFEPLILACRAAVVATVFSAIAALFGRPVQFNLAMAESARCQWFWVLGIAIEVVLILMLRRSSVNTSLILFLPPGSYSIITWTMLNQIGLLVIVGWLALAWRASQRGETSLPAAVTVCVLLATIEITLRGAVALLIGAQMRLALASG